MKKIKPNTPIIVANTEWPLPDTLIADVKQERMISALINMNGVEMDYKDLVGDAEVVAYLMPATSRALLRRQETEIYCYCVKRLMKRKGIDFPERIKGVDKLDDYQMNRLNKLKKFIFDARGGKENNPVISALNEVFLTPPDPKGRRSYPLVKIQ